MGTIYALTRSQLFSLIVSSTLLSAVIIFAGLELIAYLDQPDVYKSIVDGSCVQVVNYKNGDAYNCHDVDVVLRRYHTVRVDPLKDKK